MLGFVAGGSERASGEGVDFKRVMDLIDEAGHAFRASNITANCGIHSALAKFQTSMRGAFGPDAPTQVAPVALQACFDNANALFGVANQLILARGREKDRLEE